MPDNNPDLVSSRPEHASAALHKIMRELHEASRAHDDGDDRYTQAMEVVHLLHHAEQYLIRVQDFFMAGENLVTEGLITVALINIRDALHMLDRKGHRVDRQHPLIQRVGKQHDLTALMTEARNVVCHIKSGNAMLPEEGGVMRWFWLGPGNGVMMNGRGIRNETEDDVMIAFGNLQVYFRRNIQQALVDAYQKCYAISGHPV